VLTRKGEEVFETVFTQNAARLKDSWTPLTDREKQQLVSMMARLRIHLLAKNAGDVSSDTPQFVSDEADEAPRKRR
jgi:hypothetical protein